MLACGREVAGLSVPFTEPTMTVRLERAHSELLGQGEGPPVRIVAVVSAPARRARGDVKNLDGCLQLQLSQQICGGACVDDADLQRYYESNLDIKYARGVE